MTHPIIQKVVAISTSLFTAFSSGHIGLSKIQAPPTRGSGEVIYDCGVLPPNPIFVIDNIVPGDSVNRNCIITNKDSVTRNIAIKGVKLHPSIGEDSPLENIMVLNIADPTVHFIGNLSDFFNDSKTTDGISLFTLGAGQSRTITLSASLPTSAGNEYQDKSLQFDLVFDTTSNTKIVINEVYFQVDKNHGDDEHKKNKISGQNSQWIEIYNAGSATLPLKNWSITDNKEAIQIHSDKNIKAGDMILLSKDSGLWRHWSQVKNRKNDIETGQFPRLDKSDHLLLKNPAGEIVDQLGWGSDTHVWNPSVVVGSVGSSLDRKIKGVDTDMPGDWKIQSIPTPGY